MVASLPKFIDLLSLAEKNAKIKGKLALTEFSRLSELLFDDNGDISIELNFIKEGKTAKVEGNISGVLAIKCQRCLEKIDWLVNSKIKLAVVESLDQSEKLPEGFEPLLVVKQEKIVLKELVEDELLLSLPDIPKHQDNCQIFNLNEHTPNSLSHNKKATTDNPFAILANFKKTGDL